MKRRLGTLLLASTSLVFLAPAERSAQAADLPPIKISDTNTVPECATPGRLMSYVKSRNEALDPKFEEVATLYMRHGEELGIRWDYAFFQMMLETNTLKYTGDVKSSQNNFAGLGATGRGARGESFASVSDGVRAHLQHLLMYSGETVDNPVAQRTKDIQAWGVLTKWQATIKGPMTYAQLAKKWAPTSRGYPRDVETLANLFFNGACKQDDPNPEMVQEARAGRGIETDGPVAEAGKGAEIAKQAIAEARADGPVTMAGLGADTIAKEPAPPQVSGPPLKLINGPVVDEAIMAPPAATDTSATAASKSEPAKAVETKTAAAKGAAPKDETAKADTKSKAAPAKTETPKADSPSKAEQSASKVAALETAALAGPLLGDAKPPAVSDAKCRVFTASYGGSKSIIIKALADGITNYTVLDVNDGAEKREAEAYIGAYAKGGAQIGEPQPQDKALEHAFELCPEG